MALISDAMPVSVIVCDGNPHARLGLQVILGRDPKISVIADVPDEAGVLCRMSEFPVDVVLLDVASAPLLGEIARFRSGRLPATVVYGVAETTPEGLAALIRANVTCIVHHDAPQSDLLYAVHAAATGEGFASRALTGALLEAARRRGHGEPVDLPIAAQLTEREREVVRVLCQGLSNKAIADELSLSEKTVKFHVSNVLAKAGLRSRAQLIASSGMLSVS